MFSLAAIEADMYWTHQLRFNRIMNDLCFMIVLGVLVYLTIVNNSL